MSSVAFTLGPISVYWYSIFILVGAIIAFILISIESGNFDIPDNFVENLLFYGIIIGILGARIYYVAFEFDAYRNDIWGIFRIWEGGLAIHGGIIAGLLWIIYYCKKMRVKVLRMLDIVVVGLILAQAIGRWGNFTNQEAFGRLVNYDEVKNVEVLSDEQLEKQRDTLKKFLIPDFIVDRMLIDSSINVNAEVKGYYHPTFLYESIWCFIGFIVLLFVKKFKYLKLGQLTCSYMIWYGLGRLVIEGLRMDSLMIGGVRMAQVVSLLMVVIGIVLIFIFNRGSKFKNLYNNINETVDAQKE